MLLARVVEYRQYKIYSHINLFSIKSLKIKASQTEIVANHLWYPNDLGSLWDTLELT